MASSTQFKRVYLLSTTPIAIDLRNCKHCVIRNGGKSSLYLGSTDTKLENSQPEMFTLLPRDGDAYAEQMLEFRNPNQLFDGPLFIKLSANPAAPTDEFIEVAKFGCV